MRKIKYRKFNKSKFDEHVELYLSIKKDSSGVKVIYHTGDVCQVIHHPFDLGFDTFMDIVKEETNISKKVITNIQSTPSGEYWTYTEIDDDFIIYDAYGFDIEPISYRGLIEYHSSHKNFCDDNGYVKESARYTCDTELDIFIKRELAFKDLDI